MTCGLALGSSKDLVLQLLHIGTISNQCLALEGIFSTPRVGVEREEGDCAGDRDYPISWTGRPVTRVSGARCIVWGLTRLEETSQACRR